jgi:hypothetical protein
LCRAGRPATALDRSNRGSSSSIYGCNGEDSSARCQDDPDGVEYAGHLRHRGVATECSKRNTKRWVLDLNLVSRLGSGMQAGSAALLHAIVGTNCLALNAMRVLLASRNQGGPVPSAAPVWSLRYRSCILFLNSPIFKLQVRGGINNGAFVGQGTGFNFRLLRRAENSGLKNPRNLDGEFQRRTGSGWLEGKLLLHVLLS